MKFLILFLLVISFVGAESCIDINSASLSELDELVGIGPVYAGRIVDARPFDSVDDLVKVSGIGEKTLEKIKSQGFVCIVDDLEVDEEKDLGGNLELDEEIVDVVEIMPDVILLEEKSEIISLNDNVNLENELIYVSKNGKIIDWLPHGFALFLIFIIVILVWERF